MEKYALCIYIIVQKVASCNGGRKGDLSEKKNSRDIRRNKTKGGK